MILLSITIGGVTGSLIRHFIWPVNFISLFYIFGSIVTSLLSIYLGFCFIKIASLS